MSNEDKFKIQTASDLRGLLGECICGVLEGRVNVAQANAVTGLSGEVHKSIRQEFDMRCYMAENLSLDQQKIVTIAIEKKEDL